MSLTLSVFQFEILGKDDNDKHSLSIKLISITLLVFQFEIFGNDDNE